MNISVVFLRTTDGEYVRLKWQMNVNIKSMQIHILENRENIFWHLILNCEMYYSFEFH